MPTMDVAAQHEGVGMTTVSTPHYLLDQAKRRFTPTVNTIPGMGLFALMLVAVSLSLAAQKLLGGH